MKANRFPIKSAASTFLLLLTMALPLLGDEAAQRRALLGTWEGWVVEGTGEGPNQRRQRVSELVITADQISAKDGRGASLGVGSYRLGASGNLRTIDAAGTSGPALNKRYLGIYLLEGNTLKWCSGTPGRPRPAEFQTRPPNHFMMVLTRKQ